MQADKQNGLLPNVSKLLIGILYMILYKINSC